MAASVRFRARGAVGAAGWLQMKQASGRRQDCKGWPLIWRGLARLESRRTAGSRMPTIAYRWEQASSAMVPWALEEGFSDRPFRVGDAPLQFGKVVVGGMEAERPDRRDLSLFDNCASVSSGLGVLRLRPGARSRTMPWLSSADCRATWRQSAGPWRNRRPGPLPRSARMRCLRPVAAAGGPQASH